MSFKIEHSQRWHLAVAGTLVLALAGVYLRSLSPAFPPNDSPETIAAAATLGIQHPPGYPLPTLLGRVAIISLGLGPAAWRMNLLSSALALLAAILAGALAWRCSPRSKAAAAAFAALCLALWPSFWEQATEAKGGIYLLNLCLGLGLWHAALGAAHGSRRAWRAGLLLAGLILAAHFMSAAPWLLALGVWMLWAWKRGSLRARKVDAALLLPGLALYLYLPLRARLDPMVDLGHPDSWGQFLWMLSRSGYGSGPALSAALVQDQLKQLASALLRDGFGVALLILGGLGWAALKRHSSQAAWALAAGLLLAVLAGAVLNGTPADNRWLVLVFTLPAFALLAPLAGLGLGAILDARPRAALFWLLAAAFLPAWAWWRAEARMDRSGSYAAWDYARDLALSLPPGALYLAEGDYHALPLLHLQAVEGRRKDALLVLAALAGEPWYQDSLSRRSPGLLHGPVGDGLTAARALASAEAGRRPVILGPYAGGLDASALPALRLRQRGLAREAAERFHDDAPDLAAAWAARRPSRQASDLEPVEAALLPWYTVGLVAAGNEALDQHRLAEALQQYRRALDRPGSKPVAPIQVNLARTWERAGSDMNARRAYEAALLAEPGFEAARQGLAALQARAKVGVADLLAKADRLAASGQDDRAALRLYEQALETGFQTAGLWRNIGVIFLRNGDKAQAFKAFEQGLRLKPGDPTLVQYLDAARGNP